MYSTLFNHRESYGNIYRNFNTYYPTYSGQYNYPAPNPVGYRTGAVYPYIYPSQSYNYPSQPYGYQTVNPYAQYPCPYWQSYPQPQFYAIGNGNPYGWQEPTVVVPSKSLDTILIAILILVILDILFIRSKR